MDIKSIKKTQIASEFSEENFNHWFTFNKNSFISHVDTFYFLVYPLVHNWREDERKLKFIDVLLDKKRKADTDRESQPIFEALYSNLEVKPYSGIMMYSYHFGLQDKFDIFVCESPPNEKTPPIMVQIRSQSLWLDGLKNSFDNACKCIENVLKSFDIDIEKVQENRIDYAYHTNYIQDLINFFPEKYLKEMQVSNFMRWHKEGYFYMDDIGADYFTLGRRKSNNVFFRVYNKTKEVIEMGYKQFFVPLWLDNGLISKFDEFVLSKAFTYGSYASKDKARCEFYCLYGKDYRIRKEISKKLEDPDVPMSWYTLTAKGLVPDVTIVCNIEFQTKRKFYDRISIPQIISEKTYKYNIYNLFEQLKPITQFLTSETIRFVKYKGKNVEVPRHQREDADWWQRLRSCKPLEYTDEWIIDYFREYQKNLDIERQKATSVNKMARMAAYSLFDSDDVTTITSDINEFLSSLNDNDISKYYKVRDLTVKELKKRGKLNEEE